jgi:hypothetical protein
LNVRLLATVSFAVSLVCILCLTCEDVLAMTVEDGDFFDQNWTHWVDPGLGDGYGTVTRQTSGGNPDAFLEVLAVAGVYPPRVYVQKDDFVWNPATDGGICTVTLMIDEKAIETSRGGQPISILAIQGAREFAAGGCYTGEEPTWETLTLGPVSEDDFYELLKLSQVDPDAKPDFSPSGQPIQFGFMVESGFHGGYTHGYDNWRLNIQTGGPSQTEGASWGRIKTLYR